MKNERNAKAEMAMMSGRFTPFSSIEEAKHILGYIKTAIYCDGKYNKVEERGEEMYNDALKYSKGSKITGITVNTIMGMKMICCIVKSKSAKKAEPTTSMNGQLCYVINLDAPDCSELGYSFFQKRDNELYRIG